MTYSAKSVSKAASSSERNTLGGDPLLPVGQAAPLCRDCGEKQLLFFQFQIDGKFSLPLANGSELVVMMCPNCNDIPSFNYISGGKLPPKFWNSEQTHFFAAVWRPDTKLDQAPTDPLLVETAIKFEPAQPGDSASLLTVGGEPEWLQEPMQFACGCGATMDFVCQLPESFPFPARDGVRPQPNSFSMSDYCLFLGNRVYIFACSKSCSERAVWAAVQS